MSTLHVDTTDTGRRPASKAIQVSTDVVPLSKIVSEAWDRASGRLRQILGDDVYTSWFGSLRLDEYVDGRARFSVSTRFLKSWLEGHYAAKIIAAFEAEYEGVTAIEISARSLHGVAHRETPAREKPNIVGPRPAAQAAHPSTAQSGARVQVNTGLGSPLDRRLTFSTFVVGQANQLALSLAQKLAEGERNDAVMTPLYIHAPVGHGKTHLLQAIAHAVLARWRAVVYLTAETFMYSFVTALRSQTAHAFKESLRSIEVLIFDDVQFLQGRVIQSEFGKVLHSLIEAGKQVVIGADRPPSELESVDERVRSWLAGGLCVEMHGFDETLRLKILKARYAAAKSTHPDLEVSPEALAYVANVIDSNGRDLEGAMNRLIAHTQYNGTALTVSAAENAIRDLIRQREPKRVKFEEIQKLVANHYNVSRTDLLSSRRTAAVVLPRQIAMYLCKILTLRSLPEIGMRFGRRDHTTVLHAVRKIDGLCQTNTELRDELEMLKRMLQN